VIIGSLQYEAHQRNNNLELEEAMCEVTTVLGILFSSASSVEAYEHQ
jgi:hypothetical protein